MATNQRIQEAFDRAKNEFKAGLKDPKLFAEILKATTIDDVYDATDKLQEEQKNGHLRHLRRIEPYLDRLRQYADVITVFVQAKADILALIWGPIMLLLRLSSHVMQSFDAILRIMGEIGDKLPYFKSYTQLFESNDRIKDVLCLFFKDILDFHLTSVNFFATKREMLLPP
jgi:hypothetical protein